MKTEYKSMLVSATLHKRLKLAATLADKSMSGLVDFLLTGFEKTLARSKKLSTARVGHK